MSEEEAPKIEFPCDYPIKVLGEAHPELHTHIYQVMETHAPGFDRTKITIRDSSKGRRPTPANRSAPVPPGLYSDVLALGCIRLLPSTRGTPIFGTKPVFLRTNWQLVYF